MKQNKIKTHCGHITPAHVEDMNAVCTGAGSYKHSSGTEGSANISTRKGSLAPGEDTGAGALRAGAGAARPSGQLRSHSCPNRAQNELQMARDLHFSTKTLKS